MFRRKPLVVPRAQVRGNIDVPPDLGGGNLLGGRDGHANAAIIDLLIGRTSSRSR